MKKIIIALDSPSNIDNLEIFADTKDLVWGYKLNNVSVSSNSTAKLCKYLTEFHPDIKIFLDLKVHDVPTTLIKTVMEFHEYVDMITVHCSNGPRALKQLMNEEPQCTIIGVTVLSSFDVLESHKVYGRPLQDCFEHMVEMAADSGLKAITVPPNLLTFLDTIDHNHTMERIVPGIRLHGASLSEHHKHFTPEAAVKAGADYLVIGRAVTESPEPRKILESIIKDIS